nr:MAG TPA: hypothetical protein [Caudoviricetes sp.]
MFIARPPTVRTRDISFAIFKNSIVKGNLTKRSKIIRI